MVASGASDLVFQTIFIHMNMGAKLRCFQSKLVYQPQISSRATPDLCECFVF